MLERLKAWRTTALGFVVLAISVLEVIRAVLSGEAPSALAMGGTAAGAGLIAAKD